MREMVAQAMSVLDLLYGYPGLGATIDHRSPTVY
jgi:hypothetical protein